MRNHLATLTLVESRYEKFQFSLNRMEMLHAQLGGLLDNAQALLADAVPTSMMTHQTKNGIATGATPAVYSCLAMQVIT